MAAITQWLYRLRERLPNERRKRTKGFSVRRTKGAKCEGLPTCYSRNCERNQRAKLSDFAKICETIFEKAELGGLPLVLVQALNADPTKGQV